MFGMFRYILSSMSVKLNYVKVSAGPGMGGANASGHSKKD